MILLGQDKIAAMIPHAGTMCLLDAVIAWNPSSIHCISTRLHHRDNPLRRPDGTLGAACGIEIAAQAMAVHGRLTASTATPPKSGFLASVRDVHLASATLDDLAGPVNINIALLIGGPSGATYRFALDHKGTALLRGRATVILDAGA
jgi:predicted hotdog family 3-hydroxylacyl-ACP dehydratase